MSGQVIMQGFIERNIPIWVRRLVTILPSMIVIALGLDPTHTLVISQVILSFGIPFALIPLMLFSQRRDVMGELANRKLTSIGGWAVAGLVVTLNLYLLFQGIS
jgi:manganese transport protein